MTIHDYDYMEALKDDIRNYLEENDIAVTEDNAADLSEQLGDDLFTEDSVTGNGSGSYTFSSAQAMENVIGDNNAEDYIREAIDNFGLGAAELAAHLFDWEYWDVTIRCYLLQQAIDEVLEELTDVDVTGELIENDDD